MLFPEENSLFAIFHLKAPLQSFSSFIYFFVFHSSAYLWMFHRLVTVNILIYYYGFSVNSDYTKLSCEFTKTFKYEKNLSKFE